MPGRDLQLWVHTAATGLDVSHVLIPAQIAMFQDHLDTLISRTGSLVSPKVWSMSSHVHSVEVSMWEKLRGDWETASNNIDGM